MTRRTIALSALAAGLTLGLASCAQSGGDPSAYPEQEITLVVPLAAGGSTDTAARVLAQHLGEQLGETVVVENEPGAGGVVATTSLVREDADGYTLQYTPDGVFTAEPLLHDNVSYSVDDFDFIAAVAGNASTLTVRADSPYTDLDSLVEQATAEGTTIRYGHVGVGSSLQLSGQQFFEMAGVNAQQVPFEGGGEVLNALLAGDVEVYMAPETSILEFVGDEVRPLAVASPERSPFLPDVPTMTELGYDVTLSGRSLLLAPAGLPQEVRDSLEAALTSLSEDEQFIQDMADVGMAVDIQDGDYVLDYIETTQATYAELLG